MLRHLGCTAKQQLLNPGSFLGKFHRMQIITYLDFRDLHGNTFFAGNPLPVVQFIKKFTFDFVNVSYTVRIQRAVKQLRVSVFADEISFPFRGIGIPADGQGEGDDLPEGLRGVNGQHRFRCTLSAGLLRL